MRTRLILPAAILLIAALALAQEPAPFKDGFPPPDEAQKARDAADYQRAITAYRFWYPTVSCEGIFNGCREKGMNDNESIMILSAGPRQLAFTANSDTPHGAGALDVKDGPYVIEVPPGPFIGLADDHHQGWILDMGLPGPAGPKGGKHLSRAPDYKGEVPPGYHRQVGVEQGPHRAAVAPGEWRCQGRDGRAAGRQNLSAGDGRQTEPAQVR